LFARKAFITGNWKLNPQTNAEAVDIARGISNAITDDSPCDVGLFVPFPFIETVKNIVGDKIIVGAEVSKRRLDQVPWFAAVISLPCPWFISALT
jgi:triosephosphate isomerase